MKQLQLDIDPNLRLSVERVERNRCWNELLRAPDPEASRLLLKAVGSQHKLEN